MRMILDAMDSAAVNWNALDSLVLDYTQVEQLLLDSGTTSDNFLVRGTIANIRRLIEEGSISEALQLIEQHAPSVLQDQRLLFRLHKQRFIELLRSGNLDSRDQAIECCRTILRPCALNAYPEAYEEFKRLMLAFIYTKDDNSSPVVDQWAESRRFELAATVASVLKAQLHAYDPLFSLTLRYLVNTHISYCFRHGLNSSIAKVCETFMSKEKDPAATPYDCLLEAPKFNESDVQALAHAVDLSRQEAIDSLRYAGGDLTLAFKNELSRMKLNTKVVDELVYHYCLYRGLIDGNTDSRNSDIESENSDEQGGLRRVEDTSNASTQSDMSVENTEYLVTFKHRETVPDRNDTMMEDQAESLSEHSLAGESSYGDSCTRSESNCSTSEYIALPEQRHNAVWKKSQSNIPRKRWKGRSEFSDLDNKKCIFMGNGQMTLIKTNEIDIAPNHTEEQKGSEVGKFELALEVRELVFQGMIYDVIHKVKGLNPRVFECNPHLLFQLKQMEFLKLLEEGNHTEALSIARGVMGPLAAKYSDLLKPLKETVLAFAKPQGESLLKPIFASGLGATFQVSLNTSLGISEPTLMNIMKVTLQSHSEWFKIQMCPDPFAKILKIDALKDTESASLGLNVISESSTISSKHGSSKISSVTDDGDQHKSDSNRSGVFDDGAILTVMEWMALPRGDAIQLLAQYDGSVENVLDHMLA